MLKNIIYITAFLVWLPLLSVSGQSDERIGLRSREPELLDAKAIQFISDSVLHATIRYKVEMYQKLYKIDSLFKDSATLLNFYTNPYIIEYPQYKGYDYAPTFDIKNIAYWEGQDKWYFKGLFSVFKLDRFIRKENSTLNVRADTLSPEANLRTWVCNNELYLYSVYYNSANLELTMQGGCVESYAQLPESHYDYRKPDYSGNFSSLYVYLRFISRSFRSRYSPCVEQIELKDTTSLEGIGSLKLDKKKTYNLYVISERIPAYRVFTERSVDAWMVFVPVPKPMIRGWYKGDPTAILKEAEDWDNIEAIRFSSDNCYDPREDPAIRKGFKHFEERITIINHSKNPGERNVRVRGITEEEWSKLKKIDLIKRFVYEGK